MLKLIKEAQTVDSLVQTHIANLETNLQEIAESLNQTSGVVVESIGHVLANITMSINNNQPVDPKLAYGRIETLAGFLAGVEYLASLPQLPEGAKRYFASVAVRNGQITNIDAVAKIGQIGNDKNEQRKRQLAQALTQYNDTQDPHAAQTISTVVGKIRTAIDRMMYQQREQQPIPQPTQ
jgi:hypothetical protein